MGRPLSIDLRSRLVAAVAGGLSRRSAAERFGVSAASAVRWVQAVTTAGTLKAKPQGGDTRSHRIEAFSSIILAAVTAQKDISLVDPETGQTEIVRYVAVDDMGRVLHPTIVRGQVHGGVAQGIGQAVFEQTVYDPESGQLLSGSFMDYALPRAADLPDIEVEFIEIPCISNSLGVKGVGEAGAVGSSPAVMNAILDALAPFGVPDLDMPATPERVWKALLAAAA